MSMRTYAFVFILLFTLPLNAEVISGEGFAPFIKGNFALSRLLATFDALSDGLMKTTVETEAQSEMSNTLLESQTVKIKVSDKQITIQERSCKMAKEVLKCEVKFTFKERLSDFKSQKLKLLECSRESGIHHCFKVLKKETLENSSVVMTRLEIAELILWNFPEGQLEIKTRTSSVTGLGMNENRSFLSAVNQVRGSKELRLEQTRLSFFAQSSASPREFLANHRLYLSTLGGYSACSKGICRILVPKIVF